MHRPLNLAILFALSLGLSCAIRSSGLTHEGLWHDEIYTLAFNRGYDAYVFPGSDMPAEMSPRPASAIRGELNGGHFRPAFWRNLFHEGHPPLYYALVHVWTGVVGGSPEGIRALSLVLFALADATLVATAFVVGGARAAMIALLLTAASPFAARYAVEARNYAAATLFVTICAALYALRLQDRAKGLAVDIGFALAATAALLSHYYSVMPLVFIASGFSLIAYRSEKRLPWLLSFPALAGVVMLPLALRQSSVHHGNHWTEGGMSWVEMLNAALSVIPDMLQGRSETGNLVSWGVVVTAFCVALYNLRSSDSLGEQRCGLQLGLACLSSIGLVALFDVLTIHHTLAVSRYLFFLYPLSMLLLALGLRRRSHLTTVLLVCLVLGSAYRANNVLGGEQEPRQMLREGAGYISSKSSPQDVVLVVPPGPTLLGLALYATSDIRIGGNDWGTLCAAVGRLSGNGTGNVWIAIQNLGNADTAQRLSAECPELSASSYVRFVGLDVALIQHVD